MNPETCPFAATAVYENVVPVTLDCRLIVAEFPEQIYCLNESAVPVGRGLTKNV